MMLIQAYSSGERKVGTHADKHGPPVLVVEIEIVLIHPALLQFQMRALVLLSANGNQDASGFASFQNDGFGLLQVRQHRIVASLRLRGFDDGCSPSLRTMDNPMVEVVGNLGEGPTDYPFPIPTGIETPVLAPVVGRVSCRIEV